jgi:hypothetical protein
MGERKRRVILFFFDGSSQLSSGRSKSGLAIAAPKLICISSFLRHMKLM